MTNTTGAPNAAPTGLPQVSGTARVGQTLTASASGIADADGLTGATFAWQWLSSDGIADAAIAGATAASYAIAPADLGKTLKVRVTFTDDRGTEETLTGAATAAVVSAAPNTPATGFPAISGTLRVGETLTATRGDIADADGLAGAEFTWQWVAFGPRGFQDIEGETGQTYTLRAADAGTYLRLWAIFTDDRGFSERRRSPTTRERVAAAEQAAGEEPVAEEPAAATVQDRTKPVVSIAEAPSPVTEGATAGFTLARTGDATEALTVAVAVTETGAVLDGEAPAAAVFAAGAASALLTVATDDDEVAEAASTVTATVLAGTAYEVDGIAGSAGVTVADDDAAPVVTTASPILAPENGTAVAVLAATDADTAVADLTWETAGGADRGRFTLSAAGELAFAAARDFEAPDDAGGEGAAGDGDYEVTVRVTDGANVTEAALTVRLVDVDEIAPELSSATVDGTVLRLAWSEPLDAASQPAAGAFTVTVGTAVRTVSGVAVSGSAVTLTLASAVAAAETVTVSYAEPALAEAARIKDAAGNAAAGFAGQAVTNTTVAPNAAPTGVPEISGTAQVGQTLTASASGIADADGLTGATFAWQWLSDDGTTAAAIAGATAASYEVAPADAGKTITVRVTFTDDRGTAETLTSAATVAVVDTRPVAAALSVGAGAAQAGRFGVRIAFADAVTGLAAAELGAERVGGAAAAVSELTEAETGRVWTATVAAAEAGRYLVRLAAGAAQAGARQSLAAVLAVDVDADGNAVAVGGPVVTAVAMAMAPDGSWTSGETVRLALTFSEPVTVDTEAGTPSVGIALDGTARQAAYASGTGTASLVFAYPVTSEDGTVTAVAVTADSLAVNGGTIRDAAGRDADLAHPGVGTVAASEAAAEEPAAEEPDPAADPNALTAGFLELPAAHGGPDSWFVFELRLSEEIKISYRTMRDHALAVTGGTVTGAGRLARPSNMRWLITVRPSVWGDMTMTLAHGRACGETGAICTADGKALAATATATIPGPLALTVADARVAEGADAELAFRVSLNRAPSWAVLVNYATADGTATAGADYTAASGMLSFAPGETQKTIEVAVLDDAHDDGEETLTLTLSNAFGARIRDAEATGTIVNSDPLPRAWLARFGRTAAGHVLDAVGERLAARSGDAQVTVAGRRLSAAPAADTAAYDDPLEGWAQRVSAGRLWEQPRTMQLAELVGGSSFAVSAAPVAEHERAGGEDGGRWSVWGRGGWSRFEGAQDELSLDGDVITATVGADYERDRLLGGLAVAYSTGDGTFDHAASGDSGSLRTVLLGVYPYVRLALHERLAVWGLFGYAVHGELTLDGKQTDPIDTGAGMLMGAFGARGTLLAAAPGGGFELAAKADGLVLSMRSEAVPGLVATTAEVERLRLTLQGSYRGLPVGGGVLTPALEVGGRYDGGDAETGAGLVVGGSLDYALPAWGLTLSAAAGACCCTRAAASANGAPAAPCGSIRARRIAAWR